MSGEQAVEVSDFSYLSGGRRMEALLITLAGCSPSPGVVIVPGTRRMAQDLAPYASDLARRGFSVLCITQPGYGGSDGPWDFAGPRTVIAVNEGIDCFRELVFVDAQRLALFGASTGAMLAALIAARRDDVRAAVLASGVYDAVSWFKDWSASASQDDLAATLVL